MKKTSKWITNHKTLFNKLKGLLSKSNVWKGILFVIIFVMFTIVFFNFNLIMFPDSNGYYRNASIILGKLGLSDWKSVRGFGFPLIISIHRLVFGDTLKGLLFGNYLYYLGMLGIAYYLISKFLKLGNVSNKWVYNVIFVLAFLLNVICLGYSHTLLTEAVVPTLYLVEVLLCFNWIKLGNESSMKKKVVYAFIFAILGVLIWFIKQPYLPAYLATLMISVVISTVLKKNWKVFLEKSIVVIACLIFLVISIKGWDSFISRKASSASEMNSAFASSAIMAGTNVYFYKVDNSKACDINYIKASNISKKAKKEIKKIYKKDRNKWCSYYEVYDVVDANDNFIDSHVLMSNDDKITITERLAFLLSMFFEHPKYVVNSYLYNYLAIADVNERDFSNGYRSSLEITPYAVGENGSNALYTFNMTGGSAVISDTDDLHHFVKETTVNNDGLTRSLLMFFQYDQFWFRLSILSIIPILAYGIIAFFKQKSEKSIIIVLLAFLSFINVAFHVFTGAIIDRYVYPIYPLMIIAIILMTIDTKKIDIIKKHKRDGSKIESKGQR